MGKKPTELVAFKDRIKQLDCVLTAKVHRKEIEAQLYCENENWGMPNELLELMENPQFGNEFRIIDFSGISQLEKGGCNITVYFQPI